MCAPYLLYSTETFVERIIPIFQVDNEEIKSLNKQQVAILVSYLCNLHPVVMFHPL